MTDATTTERRDLAEVAALASPGAVLRLRSRARLALSLCVVASVAAGVLWKPETNNVRTISEGRVYQSGVLAAGRLRDEVRRLGIRTVIDLRQPWDEGEREVLAGIGAQHAHIPTEQVPDDATVARFLEVMSDPANYPVLIHCHHGTGRSVLFSAIYRIEFEGWDREQARLATRSSLRRLFPGSSFDLGTAKGSYLLYYVSRRRAPAVEPQPAPSKARG